MSTSVVKRSEGLSNRASIIIRKYIDQMKFAACMALKFIIFFFFIFSWFYFVSLYVRLYVLYASV